MSAFTGCVDILEITLRDGSYPIDFQFTADDTLRIASTLQDLGFNWIEVGHGLGLNASQAGKGVAAASDEEYLAAAAQALDRAQWSMFFIPGIGRAEDLRLAARYGMSMVRVGTDITEFERAQPFVLLAKELGMTVSWNAMKSYAVSPTEFGRRAAILRKWGADIVYLVDSCGGMYPPEIRTYYEAAASESDVALGFHGHNNLSMAMPNTLEAIDCGARLVDSSLLGIGRSAGNTATEVLVAILKQRGYLPQMDLNALLDCGQDVIGPLMRRRSLDPLAVIAGYARFHSSHTAKLREHADRHELDVRDLIVRLCEKDVVHAPDDLLERLSLELASERRQCATSAPV